MRPARPCAALLLGTRLFAQQPALDPANPVDKQVLAYYQAKDWPGLADHFETLEPRDRGRFLHLWFQSLHHAQRWEGLLACCRVERQAYPEAVEAADRALALEPKHMEALYNRGRARFGLKQYREGREDLASALATGQADASMAQDLRQNIAMADRYLAYREKAPRKASVKTQAAR